MKWRSLRENLPVKVSSLALAILLWAMVAGQREVVRRLPVPVFLPPLPDSLMYVLPPPGTVDVNFRASGRRLFWFRLQPPRMVPSFAMKASDAPVAVPLRQEFLDLPPQFSGRVLDIDPPLLRIQLAEVMEKEVEVKPVLGKEPRHPYRLDETRGLRAEPATVLARGPKSRVGRMPWVRTEFVYLDDETASGSVEAALEPEDSLITFVPKTVRVHYSVIEWQPE